MGRADPDGEGKVQRGRVKYKLRKVLVIGTVYRMLFLGKCIAMVFNRSGIILFLVSEVALHLVSTWTVFSSRAGYCGERD